MSAALNSFIDQLVSLELLDPDQASEASTRLKGKPGLDDADDVAKRLIKLGVLTRFQSQQILAGKGKHLKLGNYILLDQIGKGGMGMVFKAEHRRMKRTVALKVLAPNLIKDQAAVARFHREVQAAARLSHPNIVTAYDADEARGTHFLVMEFVPGDDLGQHVRQRGPLSVSAALDGIIQAGRGLEFAHTSGVIHRDIKPSNLLMSVDEPQQGMSRPTVTVKILDMGLARFDSPERGQDELTTTGAVMGTVDFMSPEQALNSKHADHRSDQYSLGITLYYLLTGRRVYDGETTMETLLGHRESPIPSLQSRRPDVPESLDAVFQRMVAKDPDDRFQSMADCLEQLERCQAEVPAAEATLSATNSVTSHTIANSDEAAPDSLVPTRVDESPVPATPTITVGRESAETPPGRPAKRESHPRKLTVISVMAALPVLTLIAYFLTRGDDRTTPPQAGSSPANESVAAPDPNTVRDNYALSFDGVDDYLLVESLSLDDIPTETALTIEFSVRPEADRTSNMISWLGADWIAVFLHQSNWGAGRRQEHSPLRQLYQVREPVEIDRWVQLACIWNGVDWSIYIDGRRQQITALGYNPQPSEGGLYIGGVPFPIPGDEGFRWFRGQIDELRISSGVRYTEPTYDISERLKPDSDTLLLFHFDEADGQIVNDESGHNHRGRINGATWQHRNDSESSQQP